MGKAFPKKTNPIPIGVKNIQGTVITNLQEKKKVILEHFVHRMRKREVHKDVEKIIKTEEEAFELRLEMAKEDKSPPFELEELEKALKSLKTGKSRDSENWICDIFREGVIGTDF